MPRPMLSWGWWVCWDSFCCCLMGCDGGGRGGFWSNWRSWVGGCWLTITSLAADIYFSKFESRTFRVFTACWAVSSWLAVQWVFTSSIVYIVKAWQTGNSATLISIFKSSKNESPGPSIGSCMISHYTDFSIFPASTPSFPASIWLFRITLSNLTGLSSSFANFSK